MATESGDDEIGGPGDEIGDKTAATAGDERDGGDRLGNVCGRSSVYNPRPPCWRDGGDDYGEAADGDRVRRGRDGDKTCGPGDETGDKRAATLVTNETAATGGELEFDDDEMTALEGQRLVAEFIRCTRWPGQPSIIDPVTNNANVKKALCI